MATANKSATKGSTGKERVSEKEQVREDQLPPIIIKGGSPVTISFEHDEFPRDGTTRNHTSPSGSEISEIIVEVPYGTVVFKGKVPRGGNCQVTVLRRPA